MTDSNMPNPVPATIIPRTIQPVPAVPAVPASPKPSCSHDPPAKKAKKNDPPAHVAITEEEEGDQFSPVSDAWSDRLSQNSFTQDFQLPDMPTSFSQEKLIFDNVKIGFISCFVYIFCVQKDGSKIPLLTIPQYLNRPFAKVILRFATKIKKGVNVPTEKLNCTPENALLYDSKSKLIYIFPHV